MLKLAKRLALVALLIAGAGIAASPVRILIVNERLLMCSFRCPSSSCRTRTATGLAASLWSARPCRAGDFRGQISGRRFTRPIWQIPSFPDPDIWGAYRKPELSGISKITTCRIHDTANPRQISQRRAGAEPARGARRQGRGFRDSA